MKKASFWSRCLVCPSVPPQNNCGRGHTPSYIQLLPIYPPQVLHTGTQSPFLRRISRKWRSVVRPFKGEVSQQYLCFMRARKSKKCHESSERKKSTRLTTVSQWATHWDLLLMSVILHFNQFEIKHWFSCFPINSHQSFRSIWPKKTCGLVNER